VQGPGTGHSRRLHLQRAALEEALQAGEEAKIALEGVLCALRRVHAQGGSLVTILSGGAARSEAYRLARRATEPLTRYRGTLADTGVVATIPGSIERLIPSRMAYPFLLVISVVASAVAFLHLYHGVIDFTQPRRLTRLTESALGKVKAALAQTRLLLDQANDQIAGTERPGN
jgi:hypothetical protein